MSSLIEPNPFEYYTNDKTASKYQVLGYSINRTNANEGQKLVRYIPVPWDGDDSTYHSREVSEFMEKFTRCNR